MADYKLAYSKILKSEGGYVNDPDDRGGETYKGISRKFWPGWLGWTIIDALKKAGKFPKKPVTPNEIEIDVQLQYEVSQFYYHQFWSKIGGDKIKNQSIAEMLLDAAVNEGIVPAIRRAQTIAGIAVTGEITDELITKLNKL
ncbi:MAG: hypothetical protein A2066_12770 [Bacteroidetes bacterium GWB2_41_8]|nr:MAG: hypothetical protein A2066_12770 [Bacteroidetes bacterium GWB2_41_8]